VKFEAKKRFIKSRFLVGPNETMRQVLHGKPHLRTTGCRLPCGITQCYLSC